MKSKALYIIITVLILAFAGYLVQVAFVGDPLENLPKVNNLRLTQDDTEILVNWDEMDCKGYLVTCYIDRKPVEFHWVKENTYTVPEIYPGQYCRIVVRALMKNHLPSLAARESMTADKVRQVIKVDEDTCYGFEGNDFNLKASAVGELHYSSSDSSIATVSQAGKVSMEAVGEAEITIIADGDDFYKRAKRTVNVVVYPPVLDKITGTAVENLSPTKALIRWNPDEYATAYKVLRRNPTTDEFEEYKETTYENNFLEVVRNDYDYAVKGIAEVEGQRVDGKKSDTIEVRGTTAESPAYKKLKVIKKLTKDDLKQVATIYGGEKARIPQGISVVKDNYVVTYVNHKSSVAYLISYSKKDGSQKKITGANEVGHGNGSAYDPYRNRLYVLAGKRGEYSKKCIVYNGKTHERVETITLPVSATGIAYDKSTDKIYLALGKNMYVCDSSFKLEKTMKKSIRYVYPQDIGAYNSAFLVCTWTKKSKSYIDVYRVSDGAYLGSYDVSLGEIESCVIDDGYLVILMNTQGSMEDHIYRTKERIIIP